MSDILARLRHCHHQNIRKQQIENKFKHKRLLLEEIEDSQAIQLLNYNFNIFKSIIINKSQTYEAVKCVTELNKLISKYKLISYFCASIEFDTQLERVQTGQIPDTCTWIDLIILMMKQDWQQTILQECSSIIHNCCFQLKNQKKENIFFTQQFKRITQNYPYKLLKIANFNIVFNTLKLIDEIITNDNSGQILYILINKTPSHFFKNFVYVTHNKNIISNDEMKSKYLHTSITLIFYIRHFNFTHLNSQIYQKLCENSQELVYQQLIESKSKQQFRQACGYGRMLIEFNKFQMNERQFGEITAFLERQLDNKSEKYLLLLYSILHKSQCILEQSSVMLLLKELCTLQSKTLSMNEINFKVWILSILKMQFINCGSIPTHILDKYFQVSQHNKNTQSLVGLAQILNQSCSQKLMLLFQFIHIVTTEHSLTVLFLENNLSALFKYEQFQQIFSQLLSVEYQDQYI